MTKEQKLANYWLAMMSACGNEDWESELTILDALCAFFKMDSNAVYDEFRAIAKEKTQINLTEIANEMDDEEKNQAFWGCFKIAFADNKVQYAEIQLIHGIAKSLGWSSSYTSFKLIQEIRAGKDIQIEGIDFPFEK